jgi:ATP-dependent phosphofructokinase / diphosphate-dependent phosphofructokinase
MEQGPIPTVGILVGGGPAPGINGVISAITIEARNNGWRVLGIMDGLKWLGRGELSHVRELEIEDVSRIHNQGGSILRTSREGKVQDVDIRDRVHEGLCKLGVHALISIGGDGTASACSILHDHDRYGLSYLHVPKTIDNDIDLPGGFSTFGFQTARHVGVELIESLSEDARTTQRWYLAVTMGRHSGHLAQAIGIASGATLTLIPEQFEQERITLDDLVRPIEGSMLRRLCYGRQDGVVVLAEGLAERITSDDYIVAKEAERDPTGKIRLTDLPLGYSLRKRLTETFASRGISVKIMEKLIGYELRCVDPIPFDAEYTRELGFGAMRAILRGGLQGVITRMGSDLEVYPFSYFRDENTGRTRIRYVNTSTEIYKASLRYQIRLTQKDLDNPQRLQELIEVSRYSEEELRARFGRTHS